MVSLPSSLPFAGNFRHVLDKKNRITIPSSWRKGDADPFFLFPDQEDSYLIVMPPEEFQKTSDALISQPGVDPMQRRANLRLYCSRAHPCATDDHGRLVLPDHFRTRVGLEKEVVLVGSGMRFEIWNPPLWQKSEEAALPDLRTALNNLGQ